MNPESLRIKNNLDTSYPSLGLSTQCLYYIIQGQILNDQEKPIIDASILYNSATLAQFLIEKHNETKFEGLEYPEINNDVYTEVAQIYVQQWIDGKEFDNILHEAD